MLVSRIVSINLVRPSIARDCRPSADPNMQNLTLSGSLR